MITVAYSTRRENPEFRKLITNSIGVKDYEIIEKINNGEKSLTKVYNEVLDEAKNDIIVFCHDDIYFDKGYWGKRIIEHCFKSPSYAILGIAGTSYLPYNGIWWEITGEMIGSINHENNGKKWKSEYSTPFGNKIHEAVAIDGVFFVVNRKNKEIIRFNETYDGFHFYDVSFSYENFLNNNKIGIINNVEITHKSIGITNAEWEKNRLIFSEKHKNDKKRIVPNKFPVLNKIKDDAIVSIIMPIFNYGKMLNKSIESVFNSKYGNIELVIINDGSTDEYVNIKLETLLTHPQIKVVNLIENKGPSTARNFGIKTSSGKYILPLDGDDMIHPDTIAKMVSVIKSNPQLSPIYCDVIHFGDENGMEKKPEWSLERLMKGPFICNCSMFSREAYDRTDGFDANLDAWEDYDLWVQMAKAGYIGKRINRPLFYYFRHSIEGSVSSKTHGIEKQEELMRKILSKYENKNIIN